MKPALSHTHYSCVQVSEVDPALSKCEGSERASSVAWNMALGAVDDEDAGEDMIDWSFLRHDCHTGGLGASAGVPVAALLSTQVG